MPHNASSVAQSSADLAISPAKLVDIIKQRTLLLLLVTPILY